MRLKRLEELKYEENGFFEKSNDFYDPGYAYAYAEKVNSEPSRKEINSLTSSRDCSKVPNSRTGNDYSFSMPIGESNTQELNSKTEFTQLPPHCISLDHKSNHHHKLNGSVRSNGSMPHQPLHSYSSNDKNVYDSSKYETSKI